MADEKNNDGGRKSARGKRAKKRDEDVLDNEKVADKKEGDKKPKKVEVADKTATRRKGAEEGVATGQVKREGPPKQKPKSEQSDPGARGEAWLASVFERMNLDLKAKGRFDGDNYVFNVSGPDTEDIIGRSRQTPRLFTAMQTLLAEHLGREARGKVLIDVGGFKKKRQGRLTSVADKLGETARKVGKPLTVAGLGRFERRVIHQHLEGESSVKTESVDHGIFRKLRVNPTKSS